MASPLPGMDPFIEAQKWSGFHHLLIAEMAQRLVAQLRPRYDVDPKDRIYVETAEPGWHSFRADVAVSERESRVNSPSFGATLLDIEPSIVTLPMPVEEKEPYLVVRRTDSREVVAVIELLSPTNKRAGSDGRREYLRKRTELLRTQIHLVEIDLLLGGERLPTVESLKATTDYCIFVCRAGTRPTAELYEWPLKERIPRVPVPLSPTDRDAVLDLQGALETVYDRAGYDYALHYDQPLGLPLRAGNQEWLQQAIARRGMSAS